MQSTAKPRFQQGTAKQAGLEQQKRTAQTSAQELLTKFRGETHEDVSAQDMYHMLLQGRNTFVGGPIITWRRDLMFLLMCVEYVPYTTLCRMVGITPAMVWLHRRKDRELETAVVAYQAAFYENEAEAPRTDLAPTLVIYGLKSRAGWRDTKSESLAPDRLRSLIDGIVEDLNTLDLSDDQKDTLAISLYKRVDSLIGAEK